MPIDRSKPKSLFAGILEGQHRGVVDVEHDRPVAHVAVVPEEPLREALDARYLLGLAAVGDASCAMPAGRFLPSNHLHAAKVLRVSQDLPTMIVIVDTPERIEAFLPGWAT